MLVTALAALGGLGLPIPSEASEEPQASRYKLDGDFLGLEELTGGGDENRLAVFSADDSKPVRQRKVTWFRKQGKKLVSARKVRLWEDVAAYDVCRFSQKKRDKLIFVRPGGIYGLEESEPLVETPTLFAHAKDDSLQRIRFCFDLAPHKQPVLVVPSLRGVTLFHANESGDYEKGAELPSPASLRLGGEHLRGEDLQEIQRIEVDFDFPDVTAVDWNADGRSDICMTRPERILCYLQSKKGRFSAERSFDERVRVFDERDRKARSVRLTSRILHVDGDSYPDVVFRKSNYDLLDMKTTLMFYRQDPGKGLSKKPVQTIEREGYFGYQEYLDFDGDGDTDLLAPTADLGWTSLAGIFMSKSVDITFLWYPNEDGRFAEAKQVHRISYPVDFRNWRSVLGCLPFWQTNFIRTGKSDQWTRQMLFFPDQEEIEVVSLEDGETRVQWNQNGPVGPVVESVDLDGNGRDELVFAYPRVSERSRTIVYMNTPR